MLRAVTLIGIVWLSSCTFPDFAVTRPVGAAGSSSDERGGAPNDAFACDDGERNGAETGIDCGIDACSRACADGQGCSADHDCESARCEAGMCLAPSCDDQRKNGQETDVDCGGDAGCDTCKAGELCSKQSDCDGGDCIRGRCQAASCGDGIRNATETDVDCGGDCSPCGVGRACSNDPDCDGLACDKGLCQAASCTDGVQNQDETDVDCGGSCDDACADAARCTVASDCASGVCPRQTLRCAAPACDDKVLNGAEPAVDCGASCSTKCALLSACRTAGDCSTGYCLNEECLPSKATGEKLSTASWTATASSTFGSSDTKYAIDGAQNTDWTNGQTQTAGAWFLIDMKADRVFFSIEIDCTNTRDDSAEALDVALSRDGSFGPTPAKQNVPGQDQMVITFDQPQVARYIKLTLAAGTSHWWRMDEIRVKQ